MAKAVCVIARPGKVIIRLKRSSLPSLALLQTFEVVARHRSFTRGAEEMSLTQSAISRQVQTLEDCLGLRLFRRLHRAIELTAEGQRLFEATGRGLAEIGDCLAALRATVKTPQITVSASVAFAYFWLMPRLADFRALRPDVDLRVLASDRPIAPKPGEVDVAILFGRGPWPGLETHKLFGERVYPVCSASYLRGHPEPLQPRDLLNHTLLHLDYDGAASGGVGWPAWFAAQGVTGAQERRGIRFNSYPMVLQAAEAGQGVALGWSYITDPMLASGRLVSPVGNVLQTRDDYYVGTFEHGSQSPEISDFLQWIRDQTAEPPDIHMNARNAKHSG